MRYYDYLNPSANFMGPGCVKDLGHRCELLNMKKPLIVTDDFLASVENGPVAQSLASLKEKGIVLSCDDALVDWLTHKSYSLAYGARNLRRTIQKELEDPMAMAIIQSYESPVTQIRATVENNAVKLYTL